MMSAIKNSILKKCNGFAFYNGQGQLADDNWVKIDVALTPIEKLYLKALFIKEGGDGVGWFMKL